MKEIISKFTPVVLIGGFGIAGLLFSLSDGQGGFFTMATVAMILISIVVLLNNLQIISATVSKILGIVLAVVSIGLIYLNVRSIQEPLEFRKEKEKRYTAVIQRLKDIREAQLAYHRKHNKYTSNFDTLAHFIKNEKIEVIRMVGDVPDTLTEDQALEQGLISRDTTLLPVTDYVFNDEYMESRKRGVKFHPDSLRYVPYTDKAEFDMHTNIIIRGSGMEVSVFQVEDSKPFDPEEVLKVGSLEEPTTSGNWSTEK